MGRSLQEIVKASARLRIGDSVMRVHGAPVSYIITSVHLKGGLNGNAVVCGALKGKRRATDTLDKQIAADDVKVPPSDRLVMPNGLSPTREIHSTFKTDWRILIDAEKELPERLKYVEKHPEGGWKLNAAALRLITEGKYPFVGEQTKRKQVGFQLAQHRKALAAALAAKAQEAAAAATQKVAA